MNSPRRFENEKLKGRSTELLWLLFAVAAPIGLQFLHPIIRPHRYSGSIGEWIVTFIIILILVVTILFDETFVSITFDTANRTITLTTRNLLNGTTTNEYNFKDITFNIGKDAGSLKKKATAFIEIYNNKNKLIKLEKASIGDYCFDRVLAEFQQLRN